jgi:hypothetical protein
MIDGRGESLLLWGDIVHAAEPDRRRHSTASIQMKTSLPGSECSVILRYPAILR